MQELHDNLKQKLVDKKEWHNYRGGYAKVFPRENSELHRSISDLLQENRYKKLSHMERDIVKRLENFHPEIAYVASTASSSFHI